MVIYQSEEWDLWFSSWWVAGVLDGSETPWTCLGSIFSVVWCNTLFKLTHVVFTLQSVINMCLLLLSTPGRGLLCWVLILLHRVKIWWILILFRWPQNLWLLLLLLLVALIIPLISFNRLEVSFPKVLTWSWLSKFEVWVIFVLLVSFPWVAGVFLTTTWWKHITLVFVCCLFESWFVRLLLESN